MNLGQVKHTYCENMNVNLKMFGQFLENHNEYDFDLQNSKWAVFGASYLGSLAAWFAQKHPELIDAFVASSAPLELRYEIPGKTMKIINPTFLGY